MLEGSGEVRGGGSPAGRMQQRRRGGGIGGGGGGGGGIGGGGGGGGGQGAEDGDEDDDLDAGDGSIGGGAFAATLAQLSPGVLKLLASGRGAGGSWGRDEAGRLRRFSARTTRILNSILASSAAANAAAQQPGDGDAGADGAVAAEGEAAGAPHG
ncbi:hypothetical protein GPECTOR_10g859 [Gonium pectorale]|uniref:Uncharacterized protein n=1 Tax=Gonium pectorale TaxID=33097 RepID=A0A150GR61_GONPE|nr:hypothetical protein GPECTOR_10g859 [Gonium pectorale]|eukprot:KXZ52228.1 hypothetical protein GPECTOR_10g859 [Gonium pectorale]